MVPLLIINKSMITKAFIKSFFSYTSPLTKLSMAPFDPILNLNIAFANDNDVRKVNLGVGSYRDQNLQPVVFSVVRRVEEEIIANKSLNKEYSAVDGISSFNIGSQKLIFGNKSKLINQGKIRTLQCLSGTGALRVGFDFIRQQIPSKVYIPNPTWVNHQNIIIRAGLSVGQYPYYDPATKKLKINSLLNYLNNGEEGSVVVLHACAHNPTGVDPSDYEWLKIAEVMEKKKMIPFFDSAYQGFASGDLAKDVSSIRMFAERGFNMFVAQSYAKNMGLYGQRVGALHIVTQSKQTTDSIHSHILSIIRGSYFFPPLGGARIADKIINNQQNLKEWSDQLIKIVSRITRIRKELRTKLQQLKTPGTWNHITDQIGMFSYTGLTNAQSQYLNSHYHIYMPLTGRMVMTGLNNDNIDYVAYAINDAIRKFD